jgi:glucose/arabinose dehydrogenase
MAFDCHLCRFYYETIYDNSGRTVFKPATSNQQPVTRTELPMITILRALGGAIFIGLTLLYGLHGTPPEARAQIGVNIVNTLVTSGLSQPVHITHAGDGSGRIFVVEQDGRIRIIQGGNLLPASFLNITDRVRSTANGGGVEEGLLSLAFPPGYSEKKYFYVYYTDLNGDNRVSRFHLDPSGLADPAREELIIYFSHPINGNHNGGQTAFGPDGYPYIGTGDGGGGGDPLGNAQNPGSLLGKVLRIAVEPPVISHAISLKKSGIFTG